MPLAALPFERDIAALEQQLAELESRDEPSKNIKQAVRSLRVEIKKKRRELFAGLDAWDTVRVARHESRPQVSDYLELMFDDVVELHGDRAFGDDPAILTAFAKLSGQKVLLVGQRKGRDLKERTIFNYGCAHPEGYRKALQKMRLAEKFGVPIVCLIDTPGAYPGVGAEERGQAHAIAFNLREMAEIRVPIVCVVIGEGGSGGALGIGIGDHVAVLQYAYYSVISPEGCAGILWKHVRHADEAARALKFTSADLKELGVIDEVVDEPLGGAHRDHRLMADTLATSIVSALQQLGSLEADALVDRRYERFRRMGVFDELPDAGMEAPAESSREEAVADS